MRMYPGEIFRVVLRARRSGRWPVLLAWLALCLVRGGASAAEPQQGAFDAWDVNRGTVVTAHSPLYSSGVNPGDLFGGCRSGVEPGHVIFQDWRPPGTAHFLEWQTVAPVTIRSFRLFAMSDGATATRSFTQFRLYAFEAATESWVLLYSFNPAIPYGGGPSSSWLLLSDALTPVLADRFRAEFVQGDSVRGARVIELDGYETEIAPAESWDFFQGTTVTSTGFKSGVNGLDLFGSGAGTAEPGNILFQDGQSAGFVHAVEWKSPSTRTVRSFNLLAAHEATSPQRAFSEFRLFGWDPDVSAWRLLFQQEALVPYGGGSLGNLLLISANLPALPTDHWRAEFVQAGGTTTGPRVLELEGYPDAFPDAAPDDSPLLVLIDIRPGSATNPVNLKAKGKLPVALLSTEQFDAATADPSTLLLGDPNLSGFAGVVHHALEDVNGDGVPDLILHLNLADLVSNGAIDVNSTELLLIGTTLQGVPIFGVDAIQIQRSK